MRAWHTRYFGKQGEVPQALSQIGKIPPDERKTYGQQANQVKVALSQAYETALAADKARALAQSLASESLDVTLPGRTPCARPAAPLHANAPRHLRHLRRSWFSDLPQP